MKVSFEITETHDEQQLFVVLYESESGSHEVAVNYPPEELSDEELDDYLLQFAPRSVTQKRVSFKGKEGRKVEKETREPLAPPMVLRGSK